MNLITSWDDGHPLDLKLAEILKKYDIQSIFYLPIKNIEGRPVMKKKEILFLSKMFSIGGHTYSHVELTKVSTEVAVKEIVDGKKALEDIIQQEVNHFCFPRGEYNDSVVQIVKDTGFISARSARQINFNRADSGKFVKHPSLHFYPQPIIADISHCIRKKDLNSLIKRLISLNYEHIDLYKKTYLFTGNIFHMFGHSWEIEKYGLWSKLEKILNSQVFKL
jgi:peptidoglycan-N-acetylglucosamine deacetylase